MDGWMDADLSSPIQYAVDEMEQLLQCADRLLREEVLLTRGVQHDDGGNRDLTGQ